MKNWFKAATFDDYYTIFLKYIDLNCNLVVQFSRSIIDYLSSNLVGYCTFCRQFAIVQGNKSVSGLAKLACKALQALILLGSLEYFDFLETRLCWSHADRVTNFDVTI